MELNDTFIGYRIYLAFIFTSLIFRNYLFNLFKKTSTLLGPQSNAKNSHLNQPVVLNRIKLLGTQVLTLVKPRFSQVFKVFKHKFSN